MHNAVVIIGNTATVNTIGSVLVKVVRHSSLDVSPVDGDVGISIGPGLLVPEPKRMSYFVYDDTQIPTAPSY